MNRSDKFELPDLGLGCAPLGNLYTPISDEQAIATVHAALAGGIQYLDTAPYYGHGRSEVRIGAALKSWNGLRPALSTKVGRVLDPVEPGREGEFGYADPLPFRPRFDYSRSGVRQSLEASLSRLDVQQVDVAYIHDIGRLTHRNEHPTILQQVLTETIPELLSAREEGLLRWIGLGVNECDVCLELLPRVELDVILLAGRYTALEQPALSSGLLDMCATRGTKLVAAGVFNSGLLASRPTPASMYDYQSVPPAVLSRAGELWALCESYGVAPQAVALRFPAAHPVVASTVVGARSPDEIAQVMRWRQVAIPGGLWTALKMAGFIAPDAPIPDGDKGE